MRPKLYSNSPESLREPKPASERITFFSQTNPKRFLKNTLFWIALPANDAKGLLMSSPTILGAVLRGVRLKEFSPVLEMNSGKVAES